jgi:hypothetical protein
MRWPPIKRRFTAQIPKKLGIFRIIFLMANSGLRQVHSMGSRPAIRSVDVLGGHIEEIAKRANYSVTLVGKRQQTRPFIKIR